MTYDELLTQEQPCDHCGRPVAVHAVSWSSCFCSPECLEKAESGMKPTFRNRYNQYEDHVIAWRAWNAFLELSQMEEHALFYFNGNFGLGPGHMMSNFQITRREAKEMLKRLRSLGILDFGALFVEDNGLLAGRGYWMDSFGRRVRRLVELRDDPTSEPMEPMA